VALEAARIEEAERIAEAIESQRVVGVLGEAEVGKTETIQQAIGRPDAARAIVHLDLDGAAGEQHIAFRLAKQVARAILGDAGFSIFSAGALPSSRIEAGRGELAELLGVDGLEEARRQWPSGEYPLAKALAGVEQLCRRTTVLLWIDHLEAPALTPRHPLDVDGMLWGVRELAQREQGLRVLLSAREAFADRLLAGDAAFHQQGEWLTIDNPAPSAWRRVAERLKVSAQPALELADLTDGHPVTMLLALLDLSRRGGEGDAHQALRRLVALDGGLTARAIQQARSLHRLGGQVLEQVAGGLGPYAAAQRGASSQQEITKVLHRLRLAGLLRHDSRWTVVNPLVQMGLRREVRRLSAPGLEAVGEGDWDAL
jgi:hypothetical protein